MLVGGSRRRPIFLTLLLLIGLTAVVPLVLSGALTISENRAVIEDEARKYLTRSAVSIAKDTEYYLRNYVDQARKIGDSMKVADGVAGGEIDPFVFIGDSGLIEAYKGADANILAIVAVGRGGHGSVIRPSRLDEDVRRQMDDLVRQALTAAPDEGGAEEVQISDLIHLEDLNKHAVLLTLPVSFSSSVGTLGVIQMLLSFDPTVESLIEEGKRGFTAYIVDRKGRVILHSDPGVALHRPSRADEELVAEFIRTPRARTTRTYQSQFDQVTGARRVIGSLAPIRDGSDEPRWGVIVEREEKLAFSLIDEVVRRTVWAGVVALVLAVAAAALFARLLAQPIRELADKSREIAAGNYGQHVLVRSRNEIGELAETFNHMSGELEKQVEGLRRAARQNHELFLNSIRCLSAAIDAKDPYTRGHSERVCRYSIIVAKNMGLSREEVAMIRISALLHDVGKIGIDDRILRKPAALTDEEFEIMKQHPSKGAAIMESIPELVDIIPGMKYHHEKWEGGGYPEGIRGEDIPLQARIVAVADTFDAMTTTRPYQKAMALDYVVSKIESFGGSRFDPRVVEGLVRAYRKSELALDDSSR